MANKTNLGICGVVVLVVAAYLGLDLNAPQPPVDTTTSTRQTELRLPPARLPAEGGVQDKSNGVRDEPPHVDSQQPYVDDTAKIAQAFARRQSDLQVQAAGKVVAVLRDDNEGSRHQKFILELSNAQTVLVAHNIDLAPRIEGLEKGDMVRFLGEYEYSDKGGVIHWTHHDPQGRHVDGWLYHEGRYYQ